jgi:hypothetical protein
LSERTRERSSRRDEVVVSFWDRVRRAGDVIVVVWDSCIEVVDVMIYTECNYRFQEPGVTEIWTIDGADRVRAKDNGDELLHWRQHSYVTYICC